MGTTVQAWWGKTRYYEVYYHDEETGQFVGSSEVIEDHTVTEDPRVIHLSVYTWKAFFDLAQRFGWKPMGTSLELIKEKHLEDAKRLEVTNDYEPINFDYAFKKIVYEEDAAAWARALMTALPRIEAKNLAADINGTITSTQQAVSVEEIQKIKSLIDIKELKEFIEFLRGGQFMFSIYQDVWD